MYTFKLPTDNLYKFITIFSIVLIVFSGFLYVKSLDNLYPYLLDFNDKPIIDNLLKSLILKDKVEKLVNGSEKIDEEKIKSIINDLNDIRTQTAKIENEKLLDDYYIERNKAIMKISWNLCITGFIWAIIGFIMWYYKLQRYQDEIIKKQAKQGKNSIKS